MYLRAVWGSSRGLSVCCLKVHEHTVFHFQGLVFLQQSQVLSGLRPLRMTPFSSCKGMQFYILTDNYPSLPGLWNALKSNWVVRCPHYHPQLTQGYSLLHSMPFSLVVNSFSIVCFSIYVVVSAQGIRYFQTPHEILHMVNGRFKKKSASLKLKY